MSILEVEVKLFCGNDVSALQAILTEICREEPSEQQETDVYYTSQHRDLIASEECVRLRQSSRGTEELTWKPPTTVDMQREGQYWKEEIDLSVTGQFPIARRLLEKLDFVEYVTVSKRRLVYRIDDSQIVCLDFIDPVGWFAEIETKSADHAAAVQSNRQLVDRLRLSDAPLVTTPYRDIVKAGRFEPNTAAA